MKVVNVAVGIILKASPTSGDNVFVCRRPTNVHQGGKWEFPGGKIEGGETTEQALARELYEEIGIEVNSSMPLMVIEHDYGDKKVRLDIHTVTDFSGEPYGKEGQQGKWDSIATLNPQDYPAANIAIIERLQHSC
ncbi:8-oxo-dGTP diphosphatase MutT [Alteromonas pelagimontana]|uniref:8-oxo-dGTP diphosphatase n=1 Tax=Alteromonas pelagimontana TaxID=1858656 RepID=A0A6M4MD05_9ALTE|nr:8-oxo-dGTP diphosphatase MutT [Alteromonas pelagimontana]QJR80016.1 8-oxo-dGTP diphosphatase MutT [Alteromonas pelagimontana]